MTIPADEERADVAVTPFGLNRSAVRRRARPARRLWQVLASVATPANLANMRFPTGIVTTAPTHSCSGHGHQFTGSEFDVCAPNTTDVKVTTGQGA
jgi:hypothetical protein